MGSDSFNDVEQVPDPIIAGTFLLSENLSLGYNAHKGNWSVQKKQAPELGERICARFTRCGSVHICRVNEIWPCHYAHGTTLRQAACVRGHVTCRASP